MTVEHLIGDTDDRFSFRAGLAHALEQAGPVVKSSVILDLPTDNLEWVETGIELSAGNMVSLISVGIVWLSREYDLRMTGNTVLWYRIGSGMVEKSAGRTTTFQAFSSGRLQIGLRSAGRWLDPYGNLDPDVPQSPMEGGLTVAVALWSGDAKDGLRVVASHDQTGLIDVERQRLRDEKPLPKGWAPLWRVGRTNIFCEEIGTDGANAIICTCLADAGILKHPVAVHLDATTTVSWEWMIDRLPSEQPENMLLTHDYMSLAIEFENGQDLTYYWSWGLPLETSFRCPIPDWEKRETHIVVRSGTRDLKRWLREERHILSDYNKAVGKDHPGDIVGVWLIALSPFQRGVGKASYRSITLRGERGETVIGP